MFAIVSIPHQNQMINFKLVLGSALLIAGFYLLQVNHNKENLSAYELAFRECHDEVNKLYVGPPTLEEINICLSEKQ